MLCNNIPQFSLLESAIYLQYRSCSLSRVKFDTFKIFFGFFISVFDFKFTTNASTILFLNSTFTKEPILNFVLNL